METSLFIRIYLVVFSTASLMLQIIGLTGHNWYGFSLTMNMDGKNISGTLHGGLIAFSPLEICEGNGTVCKSPEEFSPEEKRTSADLNAKFSQILFILRSLVITGIVVSAAGCVLLYTYLWASKKPKTLVCTGTASAVSWMFTVLPDFIAIGVQIYVNMNIKKSAQTVPVSAQNQDGMQFQAHFNTPWDITIIGVGATLAFVTGIIVFMTTIDKRSSNTAIMFRKHHEDLDEIKILEPDYENTDEEEI